MLDRIKENFTESIQTKIAASELLAGAIEQAGLSIVQALLSGNKVLCCGNGNSAGDAQRFAAGLINKYETERPSLPAIALGSENFSVTAIASSSGYEEVFSKQIRAFGNNGDILLAISPDGSCKNVIKAIESAVSRDMPIIALTGHDGGDISGLLGDADVEIRVPSARDSRINEVHTLIINCLCDLVDTTIFPQAES